MDSLERELDNHLLRHLRALLCCCGAAFLRYMLPCWPTARKAEECSAGSKAGTYCLDNHCGIVPVNAQRDGYPTRGKIELLVVSEWRCCARLEFLIRSEEHTSE